MKTYDARAFSTVLKSGRWYTRVRFWLCYLFRRVAVRNFQEARGYPLITFATDEFHFGEGFNHFMTLESMRSGLYPTAKLLSTKPLLAVRDIDGTILVRAWTERLSGPVLVPDGYGTPRPEYFRMTVKVLPESTQGVF